MTKDTVCTSGRLASITLCATNDWLDAWFEIKEYASKTTWEVGPIFNINVW